MDSTISRQAAIDAVSRGCQELRGIFAECEKNLNALPSAERRGWWIHYAHREPLYDISGVKTWGEEYQCSNCGFIHSVIEDFGHYAYCPWCGANMDEVDE